jgi:hypothetical protein
MADAIAKEAREAMDASYEADRDNRREAMEDLKFVAGFQWSDTARAERQGRPIITINRTGQFLRQVTNPIRQNMPTLKVEPDSDADADMATVVNGLLRRIQYNSSAAHVYAQAVEHMVACGIGWFRIATDYVDDDSFDQEILIKRVFNPLSVYPDPGALEPDRSDMGYCTVSELIPREEFKRRWPKASVTELETVQQGSTTSGLVWNQGDNLRIGEFWKREETTQTLARLQVQGQDFTVNLDELKPDERKRVEGSGLILNTRPIKSYKVTMALVSGAEQLEETYECPCKWIPIVPVIGAEIPLENGVYRHGLIRFQREPSQLNNYYLSVAAETLGQQPKAPWLVTAKMVSRWKSLWDKANTSPTPYLPWDPDDTAPGLKPEKIPPPPLPAGLVQMAQMLSEDLKTTTGIYDASLGNKSNETSGVAIAQRQEQGNAATYHYTDNLEHGLEHAGRIILNMIPKVYDTTRKLRLIAEDDQEKEVEINKPVASMAGAPAYENDLTQAKFKSVRVVLGPSYASRRQEAVNQLLQLAQAVPGIAEIGGDLIVKNMDFEGSEQLAERLRAVLPPAIMQVENPEMAQAPPDPMADMQMQAQAQTMQSQVSQEESRAAQEAAKAEQEAQRVEGVRLDNALKVKKLTEPPPRPQAKAGSETPPSRRVF